MVAYSLARALPVGASYGWRTILSFALAGFVDFAIRIINAWPALLGCLWRGCIAALRTSRDLSLPYRLVNQRVVFVGDHRGGAMNRRLYGVVADFSSYSISSLGNGPEAIAGST